MLTRTRIVLSTLAAWLVFAGVGRAGYVTQSFNSGDLAVTFEAYDGKGAAGGGLNAGEVRLTFTDTTPVSPPPPDTFVNQGLQSVGFNTDLSLSPGQITGPAGWNVVKNAKFGPNGTFGWAVGTVSNFQNPVSVLITGLDSDATFAHFNLGSSGGSSSNLFGGRYVSISFGPDGADVSSSWRAAGSPSAVAQTPEPSSLAIVGVGALGLAFARWRRQRAKG